MTETTGPDLVYPEPRLVVDDLETMPDDGRRYELLDGSLLVSPVPGLRHQKITYRLHAVLEQAAPPELEVVGAPFMLKTAANDELQPDVLVARAADLTETHLPVPPVLAVEVLSRSTELHDRNSKKALYERLGVGSYWVIDPSVPLLEVHELDADGRYRQVAEVGGAEPLDVEHPFPVRIVPAELSRRRAA